MFNLFKKSPTLPDYSFLGVDLHSHLLPGIDDGAEDLATSLSLIRTLKELGYHRLITTPHVMSDLYPNDSVGIKRKEREVRKALRKEKISIELEAAAEYLMDEEFGAKIEKDDLLTLPGKRVLVEMSFLSVPPNLSEYLFRLQTKGYQPLLAHPERYLFLKNNMLMYRELKERGCEFQLNLLSLAGYYGKPTRENAMRLLEEGLVDFLGTDLHHEKHAERLKKLLSDGKVCRELLKHEFKNGELV